VRARYTMRITIHPLFIGCVILLHPAATFEDKIISCCALHLHSEKQENKNVVILFARGEQQANHSDIPRSGSSLACCHNHNENARQALTCTYSSAAKSYRRARTVTHCSRAWASCARTSSHEETSSILPQCVEGRHQIAGIDSTTHPVHHHPATTARRQYKVSASCCNDVCNLFGVARDDGVTCMRSVWS
jgi:hypothetical protein